jgi:hypothetical protein
VTVEMPDGGTRTLRVTGPSGSTKPRPDGKKATTRGRAKARHLARPLTAASIARSIGADAKTVDAVRALVLKYAKGK